MKGIAAGLLMVAGSSAAAAHDPRSTTALSSGWQFRPGDKEQPADIAGADAGWESVSVPHTWNRVGYYTSEGVAHVNTPDLINRRQGIGWYRLRFDAPSNAKGRRTWLQFDAASRTAEVWLNGTRLGAHAGAFSRFRFDATSALKPGGTNTLLVKVNNAAPDSGPATVDVLPLAGDFFVHGGLYRPVSMITTGAVHFDMLDFGGSGVYASTRNLTSASADVEVRLRARNDASRRQAVKAVARLLDDRNMAVATSNQVMTIAPDKVTEGLLTLKVANPHLWNGTADPFLYRLSVDLLDVSGAVVDRVEQSFGIRKIEVDAKGGVILNGQPVHLHGVGYHQDREGKGWAVTPADVEEDFQIMREMGVNSIRLTHYQHGETIHNLADRYGFLLWDEIPLVSRWTIGAAKEASKGLKENARQQLQELIRQNYNHPSVMTWGIANEVDFGRSLPIFITLQKGVSPDPMPLLHELAALARSEDPSRPTALATCCEGRFADGAVPTTAVAADLGAANLYFGWYYGSPDDLGPHLDAIHAKRPEQPLSVTEYGAGGALSIHTDNVLGGDVDERGRNQPEEYESYVHERAWDALGSRPYLWGSWAWNSFDFATTVRREGDAIDINTKGLVTYDRAIRKDAYYFYKANWAQTPTVHINSRRYVDRAYPVTDVRVYSNAPKTELRVNGRLIGALDNCPQKICVWPGVTLAEGSNKIEAQGLFADGVQSDAVEWRLSPDALRTVRIDSGALVAAKSADGRYGSDTFFEGGKTGDINSSTGYGPRPKPKPIAGTEDIELYGSYREGKFAYHVPLANGRYTVKLAFMEPSQPAGARQFDVTANGKRVLSRIDVAALTGGSLKSVQRKFKVNVKNGVLDLRFDATKGNAIVSAIEISR